MGNQLMFSPMDMYSFCFECPVQCKSINKKGTYYYFEFGKVGVISYSKHLRQLGLYQYRVKVWAGSRLGAWHIAQIELVHALEQSVTSDASMHIALGDEKWSLVYGLSRTSAYIQLVLPRRMSSRVFLQEMESIPYMIRRRFLESISSSRAVSDFISKRSSLLNG